MFDFLQVYQPDNPFKDEPAMARHVIARHSAKKKKKKAVAGPAGKGKKKGKAMDKGKGKAMDKGKGKAAAVAKAAAKAPQTPAKKRKAVRAGKKRAAPGPAAAADEPARKKAKKGKKGKKGKDKGIVYGKCVYSSMIEES